MKIMVGYNGSPACRRALEMACEASRSSGAEVVVIRSRIGGSGEDMEDIQKTQEMLEEARKILIREQVKHDVVQLVRGLSPGEDLVKFAEDNQIDHIYLGIVKKSRTRKILLGSTAQYVILKGPCPVTTIK